jgi:integral membrane protein
MLRAFRIVSVVEGASLLVLLGIAMPLKYVWHEPAAVRIVGMAHGVLFVLFAALLAAVHVAQRSSIMRSLKMFVASFFPFGFVFIDRQLREQDRT